MRCGWVGARYCLTRTRGPNSYWTPERLGCELRHTSNVRWRLLTRRARDPGKRPRWAGRSRRIVGNLQPDPGPSARARRSVDRWHISGAEPNPSGPEITHRWHCCSCALQVHLLNRHEYHVRDNCGRIDPFQSHRQSPRITFLPMDGARAPVG
jgi:hypothetical protein